VVAKRSNHDKIDENYPNEVFMNYYAHGGQAHGLKALAAELPQHGRGGDTIVAHINPQEAALLKSLGGSGTINPTTGLPEFGPFGIGGGGGFMGTGINKGASDPVSNALSNNPISKGISQGVQSTAGMIDQGLVGLDKAVGKTIPGGWGTVGMAAASFIPGMQPWMMGGLGALNGSGVLRKGGSFNMQGALMGGALAYGMSNLAQGLENAGTVPTPEVPVPSGAVVPPPDAISALNASQGWTGAGAEAVNSNISSSAINAANAAGNTASSINPATGLSYGSALGDTLAGNAPVQPSFGQNVMSGNFSQAATQAGDAISSGAQGAYDSAGRFIDRATTPSTYSDLARGYGENVSNAGQGILNLTGMGEGTAADAAARFGASSTLKNTALPIIAGATGLSALEEQRKYQEQVNAANNQTKAEYNNQLAAIADSQRYAEDIMRKNPYKFAEGGMMPRFLSGGGDGLSDDIDATIGNKQPAKLADGEFVVSADVVSGLGGGSSKAGARKLYEMMDRVRQQAHGTKKQVRKVSNTALPA
jgi:hypothetical protein